MIPFPAFFLLFVIIACKKQVVPGSIFVLMLQVLLQILRFWFQIIFCDTLMMDLLLLVGFCVLMMWMGSVLAFLSNSSAGELCLLLRNIFNILWILILHLCRQPWTIFANRLLLSQLRICLSWQIPNHLNLLRRSGSIGTKIV